MTDSRSLHGVETWIFDLDNTLYPANSRLFDQVHRRMTEFIMARLVLGFDEARALQRRLFLSHGTTLRGLMSEHGVPPEEYLGYVHDIDLSGVAAAPALGAAIAALPGRKLIFTNGSRRHAERIVERLGIAHCFEDIYDIVAAEYVPKPDPGPYDAFCRRHGIAASRAAMFEDMARNLRPAHALGMATVLVHDGSGAAIADDGDHIHHRTADLAEFLAAALAAPSGR